jgi:hypothetical protein
VYYVCVLLLIRTVFIELYAHCIIVIMVQVSRVIYGDIACIGDMNTVQTPTVIITTSGMCCLILSCLMLILLEAYL